MDNVQSSLRGSLVALPTPFRDGALDLPAFRGLIREHVARGTEGVVVNGTTGESCALDGEERISLVRCAVECARGELVVIAGVGTNVTRSSVRNAELAAEAGADALLVVTPYYNRPNPRGLALHFGAVADATPLPVMLYNVPTRTGVDLTPGLAREIGRSCANVVALKEATTSVERAREACGESELAVFCGEDTLIPQFMDAGAVGAVNVVGNVVPAEVVRWLRALAAGESDLSAEIAARVLPIARALGITTNPIPVKAALAKLGRCLDEVRAPLVPLDSAERSALEEVLARYVEEVAVAV